MGRRHERNTAFLEGNRQLCRDFCAHPAALGKVVSPAIRRIATKKGSVVFAFRADLDTWFRARTQTAEMAVRDEHFRMMFMNSPLPSAVVDNSRKILDLNDAFCEMLGVERTALIGRPLDVLSQGSPQYDEEE